ncbi:MAG: hypothetical protein QNL01_03725 [Akkermansiaceae bacterium]
MAIGIELNVKIDVVELVDTCGANSATDWAPGGVVQVICGDRGIVDPVKGGVAE